MNTTDVKNDHPSQPLYHDTRLTPEEKAAPQLSHLGLTVMLGLMCVIPVVTIFALFFFLPKVHEGELKAHVDAIGLPAKEFYATVYYEREPVEGGSIIVHNQSDVDWTNLNIMVNGNYQIYEHKEPIPAQQSREFELSRFLNRTGARFQLQYNELNRVRIYARRPTKDRATYVQHFETYEKVKTKWVPVIILLGTFALLLLIASVIFAKLYSQSLAQSP